MNPEKPPLFCFGRSVNVEETGFKVQRFPFTGSAKPEGDGWTFELRWYGGGGAVLAGDRVADATTAASMLDASAKLLLSAAREWSTEVEAEEQRAQQQEAGERVTVRFA